MLIPRAFLVSVLILAVTAHPLLLWAQEDPASRERGKNYVGTKLGTKVRITTLAHPYHPLKDLIVGTLVDFDADSITLIPDRAKAPDAPPLVISRDAIQRFEASKGKYGVLKGALVVGAVFAGANALVTPLYGAIACTEDPNRDPCESVGELIVLGALSGAVFGAVLGGIGGNKEEWEDALLPEVLISVTPVHGRGVGVTLTLAF